MSHDFSKFSTVMFGLLVAWLLYRRFRRTFGRQAVSQRRMGFRIVFLCVIGAVLSPLAFQSLPLFSAIALGLGGGILLALWGASQTRFERDGAQLYYLPHTYTGVAVSALFLGRLVYRSLQGVGAPAIRAAEDAGANQLTAMYGRSPLTLGIFFVLVGYYVCYYSVVLYKARHLDDAGVGLAGLPAGGDSSKPT